MKPVLRKWRKQIAAEEVPDAIGSMTSGGERLETFAERAGAALALERSA